MKGVITAALGNNRYQVSLKPDPKPITSQTAANQEMLDALRKDLLSLETIIEEHETAVDGFHSTLAGYLNSWSSCTGNAKTAEETEECEKEYKGPMEKLRKEIAREAQLIHRLRAERAVMLGTIDAIEVENELLRRIGEAERIFTVSAANWRADDDQLELESEVEIAAVPADKLYRHIAIDPELELPGTLCTVFLDARTLLSPPFFDHAVLDGPMERWKPRFRIGIITRIDYAMDVADVQLNPAISTSVLFDVSSRLLPNDISINPVEELLKGISFLNCRAIAFAVNDEVLVAFPERTWESAGIWGWSEAPKPCAIVLEHGIVRDAGLQSGVVYIIPSPYTLQQHINSAGIPFATYRGYAIGKLSIAESMWHFPEVVDPKYTLDFSYTSDVIHPDAVNKTAADLYSPTNPRMWSGLARLWAQCCWSVGRAPRALGPTVTDPFRQGMIRTWHNNTLFYHFVHLPDGGPWIAYPLEPVDYGEVALERLNAAWAAGKAGFTSTDMDFLEAAVLSSLRVKRHPQLNTPIEYVLATPAEIAEEFGTLPFTTACFGYHWPSQPIVTFPASLHTDLGPVIVDIKQTPNPDSFNNYPLQGRVIRIHFDMASAEQLIRVPRESRYWRIPDVSPSDPFLASIWVPVIGESTRAVRVLKAADFPMAQFPAAEGPNLSPTYAFYTLQGGTSTSEPADEVMSAYLPPYSRAAFISPMDPDCWIEAFLRDYIVINGVVRERWRYQVQFRLTFISRTRLYPDEMLWIAPYLTSDPSTKLPAIHAFESGKFDAWLAEWGNLTPTTQWAVSDLPGGFTIEYLVVGSL